MLAVGLLNCSNRNGVTLNANSIEPTCFQNENRDVVKTFMDVGGRVIGPDKEGVDSCPSIFVLSKPEDSELFLNLAPCNLPDSLKQDGLKVVYSGLLYETFETEDICARHFEITAIAPLSEE